MSEYQMLFNQKNDSYIMGTQELNDNQKLLQGPLDQMPKQTKIKYSEQEFSFKNFSMDSNNSEIFVENSHSEISLNEEDISRDIFDSENNSLPWFFESRPTKKIKINNNFFNDMQINPLKFGFTEENINNNQNQSSKNVFSDLILEELSSKKIDNDISQINDPNEINIQSNIEIPKKKNKKVILKKREKMEIDLEPTPRRNREEPSNDPKKIEYSEHQLHNLIQFIEVHVHFEKENVKYAKNHFSQLSINSKKILCIYLKKILKLERKPSISTFESFQKILKRNKKKRRNEEKIKLVYKSTIKEFKTEYNHKFTIMRNEHSSPLMKKLLRQKEVGFYASLFEKTIVEGKENLDFLMDIFFEKYGPKTKRFKPENGWKSGGKLKAMKKVSATFRKLVKNDFSCREKFVNFINYENERGLISKLKTEISNKLEKKHDGLKNLLNKNNYDFKEFTSKFEEYLEKTKNKNPWLLRDVKEAIDYCLDELNLSINELVIKGNYVNLEEEYLNMKLKHYSSR